jgi:hypothetical protein
MAEKTIKDLKENDVCYRVYDFNNYYKKFTCVSNTIIGKETGGLNDKNNVVFKNDDDILFEMEIESYRTFIIDNVGIIFLDKDSAIEHLKWKLNDIKKTIKRIEKE